MWTSASPIPPPQPPMPTTCTTNLDPVQPVQSAGSSGTHQPLQDSEMSAQTCSHPGSSDERWGSPCCKPSLASGDTPRWSGAGGRQIRHLPPAMPGTFLPSASLHTPASHKPHFSTLDIPLNPDQYHLSILLSTYLVFQFPPNFLILTFSNTPTPIFQ